MIIWDSIHCTRIYCEIVSMEFKKHILKINKIINVLLLVFSFPILFLILNKNHIFFYANIRPYNRLFYNDIIKYINNY